MPDHTDPPKALEEPLHRGLRKRAAGVPTYSVPEAAALLSVSREHLYRLIRAGMFPAARIGLGPRPGRYVVPARAVEVLLDAATRSQSDVASPSTVHSVGPAPDEAAPFGISVDGRRW
jgi:excisionase family DNA binding protein